MSDSSQQKPQNEMDISINSISRFKDKELEAEFRDYIWKDVYNRYRVLFFLVAFLLSMMTIQQLLATTSLLRGFLEVGIWAVIFTGLYLFSRMRFFKLNHDRITMAILCFGCVVTTYGMANREPNIMHEFELLMGVITLILCYIVFPFDLFMGTLMSIIWVGCHFFTFLGMPVLGWLSVPASEEAIGSAVSFTVFCWFALLFYHKGSEKGKRIQFALLKQLNAQKEELHQTFNKYMGGTVADSILSDDVNTDGEDRWVTVLFTDLRGYSTISEPMSPKEVLSMLNEYFSEMVPIVEKYEGVVLEYIGDAMMIVFGAPRNVEMHQEKAVRCAMEMREHLKVLNEKWNERDLSRYWQNQGIETLDARAGIHTGNVVAGNIGADRVMKYGAIGDVVNIAARLEQANKALESDILFSRSVYVALTKELIKQCKDEGTMALKGRSGEESVYSV